MYQCWPRIVFFFVPFGYLYEDFTFLTTSCVWGLDGICVVIPFRSIYHARTFIPRWKEGPIIHWYPSTGKPIPCTKFRVFSPFQKMYPHANLVPAFLVKTPYRPLKLVYTALRASPLPWKCRHVWIEDIIYSLICHLPEECLHSFNWSIIRTSQMLTLSGPCWHYWLHYYLFPNKCFTQSPLLQFNSSWMRFHKLLSNLIFLQTQKATFISGNSTHSVIM